MSNFSEEAFEVRVVFGGRGCAHGKCLGNSGDGELGFSGASSHGQRAKHSKWRRRLAAALSTP